MQDFSNDAFELLNTLTAINEKYNLIAKIPMVYGDGVKIYPSQIRTIVVVGHNPGINITELAHRLEITKASASELIAKLAKNGLIFKTRDAANNKEVLLQITQKCEPLLKDIDRQHEQMFRDFKSILGEFQAPNYELVLRVLRRVDFYLDKFLKENR